ncbi:Putative HTH-type transcriptional regulator ywnA [Achromobacter spanius]|nr:hypothetical protein LMG5911_00333 [Achromobacter spanius]SPT37273.1 Rrf2 family protein [Achromobacter denitrificans]VEE60068.1 Putative HTH-type transcriptional regulator ywnA [Achromobacter spanius]
MAEAPGPMTSEDLGRVMQTNPVVIRRIMAGLRDQQLVSSEKGHGGGWTISCDFNAVTLRDIYEALGSPEIFAMGNRSESPGCLVEVAVNKALTGAFEDAEALLMARFGGVTLAALSKDFHEAMVKQGRRIDLGAVHEP